MHRASIFIDLIPWNIEREGHFINLPIERMLKKARRIQSSRTV